MTDHGENHQRQEFLLATMRLANLHLRSWAAEIEVIGLALGSNQMNLEDACAHLDDLGLLQWLPNSDGMQS